MLVAAPAPVPVRRPARGVPSREFPILVLAAAVTLAAVVGRALAGSLPAVIFAVGLLVPVALVVAAGVALWAGRAGIRPHRILVRTPDGRTVAHVAEGAFPPDALRGGEIVRVRPGRFARRKAADGGQPVARVVEVLAALDGTVVRRVTARPPRAVRAARLLTRTGVVFLPLFLILIMAAG